MPKKIEQKLAATAAKRGYGAERTGAYIFGTLAKIGKRRAKKRRKGR
jgi:hypothetical protein